MTDTENIRIQYPDKFGIKEKLRNDLKHNPEFLELTLKSHELLSLLQNQKLAITESLRVNKNVSIFEHQIRAAQRVKNDLGGSALLSDEVGLGKTVEAGIIIKEFLMTSLAKKVLILAPPSLLLQWQDEMISKFNLDFDTGWVKVDSFMDGILDVYGDKVEEWAGYAHTILDQVQGMIG